MQLNGQKAQKHHESDKILDPQVRLEQGPVNPHQDVSISPLAPIGGFPSLPIIKGVEFAAIAAAVRYESRTDVMAVRAQPGCSIAGVFTRSATRSAPVLDCEAKLAQLANKRCVEGMAIVVNSGNANAFTGNHGREAVELIATSAASTFGIPQDLVFTASTGVIGEQLPYKKILSVLAQLNKSFADDTIESAACAIMTTDTFPKGAYVEIDIKGLPVKIVGIAKGSGMIAPDMATMLSFIFTDVDIEPSLLQKILSQCNRKTFNSITVDSDTSTSDSVIAVATGSSACPTIKVENSEYAEAFSAGLSAVMTDLAKQIVRDGEGATKFVTVTVSGAATDTDADRVARSIANSPLVKTAIAGEDPNWGRVVMAVGKSGAIADRDKLRIYFGDIVVAENGCVATTYSETDAAQYMKNDMIEIHVDLGLGNGSAHMWTCDFSNKYISINADYRS